MDIGPGSVLGGKYRLVRPLARGGQGAVWVAHHLALDTPIAIKFLSEAGLEEKEAKKARSRFEREARAAATLRSPHVVQVYDYDATGEVPFIVMELLEGEDLRKRLSRRGRLGFGELSVIVTQLGKGLTLAHEAGIVHRDLKPSNVFLARVGADEIVKVLDFGVAKETALDVAQTDTTTGLVVGSPSYMSPEQARGARVDGRSDLWSLAVMMFQSITGRRPFDGTNLGDLLVHICSEPIPLPSQFAPELPPELDAFMVRALSRKPEERFQTGNELAEAFAGVARSVGELAALEGVHDDTTKEAAAKSARASSPRASVPEGNVDRVPTVVTPRPQQLTVTGPHRPPHAASELMTPGEPMHLVESGTHATAAVDVSSVRKPPREQRRGLLGPILGIGAIAALVIGGWVAWRLQLVRFGPERPAEAAAPRATATVADAPRELPSARSAESATPPSAATASATAPSAAPSQVAAAPSAAPTVPAKTPPVPPRGSWSPPVVQPPPRTGPNEPGPGYVDPKFGLPGARH